MNNAQNNPYIHPRKRFGQHFLIDHNILKKIIAAIHPMPQDHIVEIGPGKGALTQYLLPVTKHLDLIEIDRDLVKILEKRFADSKNIRIHQVDVLKFDFRKIALQAHSLRLVGNLPYNISTPLLFKLYKDLDFVKDMHFMMQKEVTQRLTATVGSHHYGRLSVMAQYYCHNEIVFNVAPQAFRPIPQVDSAIIRMIPRQQHIIVPKDQYLFSETVKEAFTHRRKTLRNALKNKVSSEVFKQLHIDSKRRPQEISIEDFIRISNAITVK